MSRYSKYLYLLLLVPLLVSCNTPMAKWFKAEKTVESTKKELIKTDDALMKNVMSYVYGADFTLSLSPTNRYTEVAKGFTERALVAGGNPSMEETLRLRQIVLDLTSTNQQNIIKGEKELAAKDSEVIKLQKRNDILEEQLVKQQEKLKQVNEENAQLATTWKKITTGFWWIVWIIGIAFVISIIGKILPPPYNNIAAIVGIPLGLIGKAIIGIVPSIKQSAGLVSADEHNNSQLTLEKLVLSIEELKRTNPEAFSELEPILKNKTDSEITRPKIAEIKKDYGLL